MSLTLSGVYVGPIAHLRGERALLTRAHPYGRNRDFWSRSRRHSGREMIFAQFNRLTATRRAYRSGQPRPLGLRNLLAYRWHGFDARDWAIDPDFLAAEAAGLSYVDWFKANHPDAVPNALRPPRRQRDRHVLS